jgi:vacuolar protein sorting-associated protein 54
MWGRMVEFDKKEDGISNLASFTLFLQISSERQAVLTRICTGRAILPNSPRHRTQDGSQEQNNSSSGTEKMPTAEVEGVNYKVVWSCLLLVEMIMTNLSAAAHFQSLSANAVGKVAELLRLFNTRATQLVLGAGAIHSAARLKSINAKHLSLVTQCLGMMLALLPHIRAALMAQLPPKQHTLLTDIDKIKKDYVDHNENVLNKFVTIIGGIVEHGLAPRIAKTNFDARARDLPFDTVANLSCCVFLEGVSTNTRKMHQVLNALLPPDHLQDVFSRIFAYLDQKVPALLIAATKPNSNGPSSFNFPETVQGKRRLLLEVECMTENLNRMNGVHPWDFTAIQVLERKLDYELEPEKTEAPQEEDISANEETPHVQEESPPELEEEAPTSEEPTAVNGEGAKNVEAEEPVPEESGGEPTAEKEDETTVMGNGGTHAENGTKEDVPTEEAKVEATANSE